MILCTPKTEYVESSINCSRVANGEDMTCSVTSMRNNPSMGDDSSNTALHIGRQYDILDEIPWILSNVKADQPLLLERWLRNPPTAMQEPNTGLKAVWYEDIPMSIFQNRLAMVLNTYLRASLNLTNNVGSDGLLLDNRDSDWANLTGTWFEYTPPIYYLNWKWFYLYFISSLVLAGCALANIVLRCLIRIPDFLTSVSGLTRDSPFVDVPTPASILGGSERSRLLQDKLVMVQDVKPQDEVGRIAFSDLPGKVHIQQGRLYL